VINVKLIFFKNLQLKSSGKISHFYHFQFALDIVGRICSPVQK